MAVLTDSPEPRKYWSVLKIRIKKESNELTTICRQLKMPPGCLEALFYIFFIRGLKNIEKDFSFF